MGVVLLVVWFMAVLLCRPHVVHLDRPRRIVTVNHETPVHDLTRPLQEDGRATVSELADLDRPLQCTCTQDTCPHPRGVALRGHQETHLPRNQTQFALEDGWVCEDRHY